MNINSQLIDQIVATVVDRLRALNDQKTQPTPQHPSPQHPSPTRTTATPMIAALKSKVVSVVQLENLSGQFKSVIVPARSIVTPAARDWLKERGVSLQRGNCHNHNTKSRAHELAIVANSSKCSVATDLANKFAANVDYVPQLNMVASHVANLANAGKMTLVISPFNHMLAMQLNRIQTVNALATMSIDHLEQTVQQTNVNVLVFNAMNSSAKQIEMLSSNWLNAMSKHAGVKS